MRNSHVLWCKCSQVYECFRNVGATLSKAVSPAFACCNLLPFCFRFGFSLQHSFCQVSCTTKVRRRLLYMYYNLHVCGQCKGHFLVSSESYLEWRPISSLFFAVATTSVRFVWSSRRNDKIWNRLSELSNPSAWYLSRRSCRRCCVAGNIWMYVNLRGLWDS